MVRRSPAMRTGLRCSNGCGASRRASMSSSMPFDLLELDGPDLRREPLETRKATLASLLRPGGPGLRPVEHLEDSGDVVYRHACRLGCGRIVSKRLGSPYVSGRTRHWLKF